MTSTEVRTDLFAPRLRGEGGRVTVLSMVGLVLLVLVAIAMVDAGSIGLTRFELKNAADKAAFQAASEFKDSRDRSKALQVAQGIIEDDVPGARIATGGFEIDGRTGEVTLTLEKRAWSVVAGSFTFTREYTRVSASSTAKPPTL